MRQIFPDLSTELEALFKQADQGVFRDGLRCIDLGAGHSSAAETFCKRAITALKSQALLNEFVGAGYIERNWPPALKKSGVWPLSGLRQSFLNGILTRLLDPDTVLRKKIVEFVKNGDFGLASGAKPGGAYDRVWYKESLAQEEVIFDADVFLLMKTKAQGLKEEPKPEHRPGPEPKPTLPLTPPPWDGHEPEPKPWPMPPVPEPNQEPEPSSVPATKPQAKRLHLVGALPPEVWNRFGTRVLTKLRSGTELKVGVDFSVTLDGEVAEGMELELLQAIQDLGLEDQIRIKCEE